MYNWNPIAYVFGKLVMMIEFNFLGFKGRGHYTVQRSQQAAASRTVASRRTAMQRVRERRNLR
jgi:hypothetical protein